MWADQYNEAANGIADFLDENFETLTKDEVKEFEKSEKALRKLAKQMRDEAIITAMEGLSDDLKAITKATERGTKAILKINDVKKGLQIITNVIQLGVAVVSGNAGAAVGAAKELAKNLRA